MVKSSHIYALNHSDNIAIVVILYSTNAIVYLFIFFNDQI